jgi:hypothetical protein
MSHVIKGCSEDIPRLDAPGFGKNNERVSFLGNVNN